jgi:HEAT repeat protein
MSRRALPLVFAVALIPLLAAGQDLPSQADLDALRLRQAGLKGDPAALLALVQPADRVEEGRIGALLRDLEDDDYDRRSQAGAELVRIGRPARAALERLRENGTLDLGRQAGLLLDEIDSRLTPATTLAALRTLTRQRHPRAVPLILEHLPHAGPGWHDLVATLLLADPHVACADAALRAALVDPDTSRRSAAGLVLARRGNPEQVAAVLPLLRDEDAIVRLRTAQGLVGHDDARGLPALVDLLSGPIDVAWQAEELLRWVAQESAPVELVENGTAARRSACQAAWAKWLVDPVRNIDWQALRKAPRRPGLFLTCRQEGIQLFGSDGAPRFATKNDQMGSFVDAHLMPDGRLLAYDDNDAEVRLYDVSGKLVWKWKAPAGEIALSLQPLPGEKRILVVTDEQLHELTWNGKQASSLRLGDIFFLDACLIDSVRYAAVTDEGFFLIERTSGRILHELRIPWRTNNLENGKLLPLPDGMLGVVSPHLDRVLVFDLAGLVFSGPVGRPRQILSAARYRSGNWLLSQPTGGGRLAEYAADGRIIREVLLPQIVLRVRLVLEDLRLGLDDDPPAGFTVDSAEYRIAALKSPDPVLRRRSAIALGQYRDHATQAIPALVAALSTDDVAVQTNAAYSLAQMGPSALPALLKVVREATPAVRLAAVQGLGQMRDNAAPAVPDLLELLEAPGSAAALRVGVCETLGAIGATASTACPALRTVTRDKDARVRRAAVIALGNIGKGEPETVQSLIAALDDSEVVAVPAAIALGQLGSPARPAVAHLLRILERPKESGAKVYSFAVRQAAVSALIELGRNAAEAAPALAVVLRDTKDDPEMRRLCIRALGRMGAPAQVALPALRETLLACDRVSIVQQEIVRALVLLRQDGGIPVLIDAAKNGHESIRPSAITALGNLGAEAHSAVGPLTEMSLHEKDERIRNLILRTLKRIPLPPPA